MRQHKVRKRYHIRPTQPLGRHPASFNNPRWGRVYAEAVPVLAQRTFESDPSPLFSAQRAGWLAPSCPPFDSDDISLSVLGSDCTIVYSVGGDPLYQELEQRSLVVSTGIGGYKDMMSAQRCTGFFIPFVPATVVMFDACTPPPDIRISRSFRTSDVTTDM